MSRWSTHNFSWVLQGKKSWIHLRKSLDGKMTFMIIYTCLHLGYRLQMEPIKPFPLVTFWKALGFCMRRAWMLMAFVIDCYTTLLYSTPLWLAFSFNMNLFFQTRYMPPPSQLLRMLYRLDNKGHLCPLLWGLTNHVCALPVAQFVM